MIPAPDPGDPFVGRERELQELLARLTQARAGRGGLVLLVGDPGIGKTRTAEELAARSDLPPRSILWGRCSEHEGSPAFWPWVQALRGHAAQVEADQLRADLGPAALDVARVIPEIRLRLSDLPDAEPAEPAQARFRVFDGVAQWLRAAATRSPLLVILDDLHWADQDSVLLLEHVAYEARAAPLLLLGTYREAEMLRTPGRLGTLARVAQRVALRGLDRSGVEAFVRASAVTTSAAMLHNLAETSEGNPFFLGELVRVLQAEGGAPRASLATARELPHEVRDAVRRHLEPLSDEDRRLLGVAAVLGREFDFDVWRLACDQPAEPLLERLAVCAGVGLVRAAPEHPGRHAFSHALIRETLYADLPVSARAGLHRRVARILEEASAGAADPPVAAIAHHYFQAAPLGEGAKAIEYARRAGRHTADVLAHHEAVEHYARALTALSFVPPDGELELELLLDLGQAHWRAGDFLEARATYERAGRQARGRDDAPGMTRAVLMLAAASPEVGAPNATLIGLCEDTLRRLGPGENALRAAVLARLATALYFAPDPARPDALSTEALDLARRTGGSWTLGTALLARHLALWRPDGSLEERLAIARELVALADLDLHQSLEGHAWLIIDLLELGERAAADREIDVYVARCEDSRLPHRRWHATLIRATRSLLAGRLAESAALAAEALAIRQEGFASLAAQFYAAQLFVPFWEMGRLQELEPAYAALARTYAALPIWRVGLALIHADGGDETAARRTLDGLAAREFTDLPRDGNFLPTIVQLAVLVSLLGDAARARLLAPLLAPFHDRHVIVGLGASSLGSAARAFGLLAATTGDLDTAATRLDEALTANTAFGARSWIARTQLDLARVLVARAATGDVERAEALRAEARESAAALAMPRLLQALDDASQAAPSTRRTPERRAPADAGPLAFRQEGEFWTIGRGAGTFRLRDSKGLGYLATLLRHPGREFHVLDLTAGRTADTAVPHAAVAGTVELAATDAGDAGELLDQQARAAYRHRLEDLQSEIEEAESFNDPHRAGRLRAERDMVAAELARGVGLGGRSRKAASHAERARLNVTRAIGAVLRKIAAQDQILGRHLEISVHTGVFCSYTPYEAITWDL